MDGWVGGWMDEMGLDGYMDGTCRREGERIMTMVNCEDVALCICALVAFFHRFLPPLARATLSKALASSGIHAPPATPYTADISCNCAIWYFISYCSL